MDPSIISSICNNSSNSAVATAVRVFDSIISEPGLLAEHPSLCVKVKAAKVEKGKDHCCLMGLPQVVVPLLHSVLATGGCKLCMKV